MLSGAGIWNLINIDKIEMEQYAAVSDDIIAAAMNMGLEPNQRSIQTTVAGMID